MLNSGLTHGSLFAGIGGFDLGFERAGIETTWQIERDDYARKVLEKHWPKIRRWSDVEDFPPDSADEWRADIISFGWPCQDISTGNDKRAGLSGERSGLFWQAIRVVRLLRPQWIVAENVSGLTSANDGWAGWLAVATLSELGYGVAWRLVDCRAFGVPQHRRRFIFVGHLNSLRAAQILLVSESEVSARKVARAAPYAICITTRGAGSLNDRDNYVVDDTPSDDDGSGTAHGLSRRLDRRRQRALGNALVPQLAEWVGKRIMENKR